MHRYTAVAILVVVIGAPARAQPCATRDCMIRRLQVGPSELAEGAARIGELRRIARDAGASPGARVWALREEADLAASLAHRARRARELGALDEEAARAFERSVGLRPEALDAAPIARACVALARRTHAWASDAERCAYLARGPGAEPPIEASLAVPLLTRAFAEAADGEAARAAYRDVLARHERDPTDARASLELAAIELAVGRAAEALQIIEALPDRASYDARLAWAEAAAANGRTREALDVVGRLAREEPRREGGVLDLLVLLDALGSPDHAGVLAAAQHYLCLTSQDDARAARDTALELGRIAAEELGLDADRPIVPVRHLPSYSVDEERARPLSSCAAARRALVRGTASVPTAPPCPDGALRGVGEDGEPAAWILRGGRVSRAPERCARIEARYEEIATFDIGDLDGDGRSDVARVGDATDGTYAIGRELVLLSGGDPTGVIATLRDASSRFGAEVLPAGDVDHDGQADLLVTRPSACDCCDCSGASDDLLVLLGGGDGALRLATTIQGADGLRNWIRALGPGDLDADGYDDVVVVHGREVRLHRGGSDGVDPAGIVIHTRESDAEGVALARGASRASWWWIDADEGIAWIVRGRRARRVRLP